jgi:hypothetical protein
MAQCVDGCTIMKDKERIAPLGLSQPASPSHRKPMKLRNLCSRAEAYDSLHFKVAEVSKCTCMTSGVNMEKHTLEVSNLINREKVPQLLKQ